MVPRDCSDPLSPAFDSATVAHVSHVNVLITDTQNHQSATAGTVKGLDTLMAVVFVELMKEVGVTGVGALDYGLGNVGWEGGLGQDVSVQVIF